MFDLPHIKLLLSQILSQKSNMRFFQPNFFLTQKCKHRLSLVQNIIQKLNVFSIANGILFQILVHF